MPSLRELRRHDQTTTEESTNDEEDDDGFNALRTDRLKKVNIRGGQRLKASKAVDVTFHVKKSSKKGKMGVILAIERLNQSVIEIIDSSPDSIYNY